jgi:hypothetical protein
VYAIDPILRREFQTIQFSAIVPSGIREIRWYVDGEPWEDTESPFEAEWPISAGTHRIYAEGLWEEDTGYRQDTAQSQEIIIYIVD